MGETDVSQQMGGGWLPELSQGGGITRPEAPGKACPFCFPPGGGPCGSFLPGQTSAQRHNCGSTLGYPSCHLNTTIFHFSLPFITILLHHGKDKTAEREKRQEGGEEPGLPGQQTRV